LIQLVQPSPTTESASACAISRDSDEDDDDCDTEGGAMAQATRSLLHAKAYLVFFQGMEEKPDDASWSL
jgi:hypothetical protein